MPKSNQIHPTYSRVDRAPFITTLSKSFIGKLVVRGLSSIMESRFRYRFFNPQKILGSVEGLRGQVVLELGCGTGFFTIPAAELIGDGGHLVALDILPEAVDFVSRKVQTAEVINVRVIQGDALDADLETASFDVVLLFGEIPAPVLPLTRLLPEIHRLLKPRGILAVWPLIPGWLPKAILQSGLFRMTSYKNGVLNFERCSDASQFMSPGDQLGTDS